MSAAPTPTTFSTQLLGQTEKALNVFLQRLLAGAALTELQWVTLTLTVASGGTVDRDELVARLAGAVKVSEAEAQARITELAAMELLEAPGADGAPVTVTDAGQQLHAEIRAGATEVTQRLWGDLPADDLATAGRVLSTVLERANAELAAA